MKKPTQTKSYTVYRSAISFAMIGFFAGIIETIIKVMLDIETKGEGIILYAIYGFNLGFIVGIAKILMNKSKYVTIKTKAKDAIFETAFHTTVVGSCIGSTIGFASGSNLAPLVGIEGAIVGFAFGLIGGVIRYFDLKEDEGKNQ